MDSTDGDRQQARTPRFRYEFVDYATDGNPFLPDSEFETLEDAIEEYASNGWRFVESRESVAIFEKPANQDD